MKKKPGKSKVKVISISKTKFPRSNKVRVNITVDKTNLDEAKKKLDLFGGKLSTLFNAYLKDFVTSMDKNYNSNQKTTQEKVKELEKRLKRLEKEK